MQTKYGTNRTDYFAPVFQNLRHLPLLEKHALEDHAAPCRLLGRRVTHDQFSTAPEFEICFPT